MQAVAGEAALSALPELAAQMPVMADFLRRGQVELQIAAAVVVVVLILLARAGAAVLAL
jgi:hypothetical protein